METEIKTQQGQTYRFLKQDKSAGDASPSFSKPQIEQILTGAVPLQPSNWLSLWNQVKPSHHKSLSRESDVQDALTSFITSGDILYVLVERDNAESGILSSALDSDVQDFSILHREVESEVTAFSDADAATSELPAHNKTQAFDLTEKSKGFISMISGEKMLSLVDTVLPGPMPFEFRRNYRSANSRNIGLGVGWTHTGYEFIEINDTSAVYFDSEGRELPFALPRVCQRSKYIPEHWNLDRVSENGFILRKSGEWDRIFTRPDVSIKRFRLVQMRHPAYVSPTVKQGVSQPDSGYCIHFLYNDKNQISRIYGNWGKSLVFKRNENTLIEHVSLMNDNTKNSKILVRFRYDEQQDLISVKDAKGAEESYRYENHLIVQRTLKSGFNFYTEWDGEDQSSHCKHSWCDNNSFEYLYSWDENNASSKSTDSRGNEATFTHNDFGQITEKTDKEGLIYKNTYTIGRLEKTIDPAGHATHYFYNKENNAVGYRDALGKSVSLGYFAGRLTSFVDKDKSTWRREYNHVGLLKTLRDPYNQGTHYTYNKSGLLVSEIDPMGRRTQYYWNENNAELDRVVDYAGNARRFYYNEWGQLIRVEFAVKGESLSEAFEWKYDANGNVESVINAAEEPLTFSYNESNQVLKSSDHQGRTTEYNYDGLGRLIERVDAEGNRIKYEYDDEGNLATLLNEKGENYQFIYDSNDRLIKEIGFDGRTHNYKYNDAGYVIKHMDSGVLLTEYERDAMGRVLTKTAKAKNADGKVVEEVSRYQYDAMGRLSETYNQDYYLAFEYNRFGKLAKEHRSHLNKRRKRIADSMVDIKLSYIWPGVCSGITLPDGQYIDYHFNRSNEFIRAQFNGDSLASIDRDSLGREVVRQQGDIRTETSYDDRGRISSAVSVLKSQEIPGPIQREYAYDKFGNLCRCVSGSQETKHTFNLVDRLVRSQGVVDEKYESDPAGNILGINNDVLGKCAGNRLSSRGDQQFQYDARGNLIQKNRGNDGKLDARYSFNLQNQLVKVERAGQTVEYTYDSLGRRISKRDNFGTTEYLWVGNLLIQELRSKVKKIYVYEAESFKPLAIVQEGAAYHFHMDATCLPKEITSDDGTVVWKAQYSPYGSSVEKEEEILENNLRFPGHYFDEETGFHYNRFRYYNPNTGSYISQNPMGLKGGVNAYEYALNPVSWSSPLGVSPLSSLMFTGNAFLNKKCVAENGQYGKDIAQGILENCTVKEPRVRYAESDGKVFSAASAFNTDLSFMFP